MIRFGIPFQISSFAELFRAVWQQPSSRSLYRPSKRETNMQATNQPTKTVTNIHLLTRAVCTAVLLLIWTSGVTACSPSIAYEPGGTGGTCPKDVAVNKEVPFLFLENAPFFLRKEYPRIVVPPKFEILPTSQLFNG